MFSRQLQSSSFYYVRQSTFFLPLLRTIPIDSLHVDSSWKEYSLCELLTVEDCCWCESTESVLIETEVSENSLGSQHFRTKNIVSHINRWSRNSRDHKRGPIELLCTAAWMISVRRWRDTLVYPTDFYSQMLFTRIDCCRREKNMTTKNDK
jgi:hypothetical protein